MHINNSHDSKVSERVINEAAEWLARMHSGSFSDSEKSALNMWLQQDVEHQRVWRRAELLGRQFGNINPQLGMPVLGRAREQATRRRLIRTIAALMAVPSATWCGMEFYRTSQPNFYRTAVGERREIILADNSQVTLNTASELNVIFDSTRRLLTHSAGEIFIKTAPDIYAVQRPFLVETNSGRMRALGTEFIVQHSERGTRLSVLEGAVEVITRNTQAKVVVAAGQQLFFDAHKIEPSRPIHTGIDAWRKGVLYVQSMPLGEFIHELSRYRVGVLRCNPEVAKLTVTGTFHLSDTDSILRLLTNLLPVTVNYRSRYWVTLNPR
ncbi:FecR domain-containing protein [Cellvibrio sp. NN19]|uniref:FecR domain-containing protein n=1 Tax=Cellvibrio chitinivorans TaxID=3102792 RepID=UPI002B40FA35|nr:FecR domain-containing protein [Cellvibrio sp. NN19]